jgi:hypothetical protein
VRSKVWSANGMLRSVGSEEADHLNFNRYGHSLRWRSRHQARVLLAYSHNPMEIGKHPDLIGVVAGSQYFEAVIHENRGRHVGEDFPGVGLCIDAMEGVPERLPSVYRPLEGIQASDGWNESGVHIEYFTAVRELRLNEICSTHEKVVVPVQQGRPIAVWVD